MARVLLNLQRVHMRLPESWCSRPSAARPRTTSRAVIAGFCPLAERDMTAPAAFAGVEIRRKRRGSRLFFGLLFEPLARRAPE